MSEINTQNTFPFISRLNLAGLLGYWEVNLQTNSKFGLYPTDHILNAIDEAKELRKPIDDLEVLEKHKPLLGLLMSAIMPSAKLDTDLSAALLPFNFVGFYGTPGYQRILPLDTARTDLVSNLRGNDMEAAKILRACIFILNKFYGTEISIDEPILVTIPNQETGLDQIYKVDIGLQFVDVIAKKGLKPISSEQITLMMNDLNNTQLWLEHIEPEAFEFQGFSVCQLVEVTEGEMLSKIKYDLLKKDAVICPVSFATIQHKIRSIFKLPEMQLGLSFFDVENNIISNQGMSEWNSFMIPTQVAKVSCDFFKGSIYDLAHTFKKPVIIEDLESMKNRSGIEDDLIKRGIKNVAIAPLLHEDEVIGVLELGTPYKSKLNSLSASKMEAVLPMFTAAVHRVLEEMKTEVRALIQEQCTAIHPSVEWRFLQEGYKLLGDRTLGKKESFGDIVFKDVYPVYGMSDIRNSSSERNAAIQADLKDNLREAKKVVASIIRSNPMPILSELKYRLDNEIKKLTGGLNSGDESAVLSFLKNEIVPTLEHFKRTVPSTREEIEKYEKLLDANLGVIYNKRRDFEQSLTKINETISEYLDEVELEAQEIFPHYFEKYKTDGVDYNIYLGQSLVNDKTFDPIYLNNFRLWQLIIMCEIASRVNELKATLPRSLDITQLILVHGEPLSIKFRKDEKHFDVDGAYNIRYEIIKMRFDKAFIKDTEERLTQPGKIAIVYTQEKEAEEYMRYINYLQAEKLLTESVERLELEELQGAQGLRAIRIEVDQKGSFGSRIIKDVYEANGIS